MSKWKFIKLFGVPLYLKIRGHIVGAFSKITLAIYIGFGLLTIVSIALIIIIVNLQHNSGDHMRAEQSIQQPVITQVQDKTQDKIEDKSAVIVVAPRVMPEMLITKKEESKEIITVSKLIKGGVQVDFGWQLHQVYNDWRYHTGIDIVGHLGQSVKAVYKGQVTDIFRDRHSGLTVVVKDNTYEIYYGSLSEVTATKGSFVNANQEIGKMGSCDGEPYEHLHLAIKKNEQYLDPNLILSKE